MAHFHLKQTSTQGVPWRGGRDGGGERQEDESQEPRSKKSLIMLDYGFRFYSTRDR